ncbi:MAG: hypothetical protein K2I18_07655 [Paramuribaculum sp.]|nr:hypothetical protein [Paramuribaculum sp.]
MDEKYVIALEVGSSKISGAVGRVDDAGVLTVTAVEEEPLVDSVRYGQLSNVKVAAGLVERILRKIENRVSPRKVCAVYVGIGGRSLCSVPVEVERKLPPETEVTADLLNRLKLEARAGADVDKEILDVVPREYFIDNSRVEGPEGRVCSTIRMAANLIVCRPQLKRNLDLLVDDKLRLRVAAYITRPLAEAALVLTQDEKRLGCMMVDFGAETTSVAIYRHGSLNYLATLPLGSRNITRDITTLNIVEEKAEELKKSRGNAMPADDGSDAMGIPDVNNLVSYRAGEIIANIKEQIKYAGLTASDLPGGIVLIGRGARLGGFSMRLEKETGLKVRSGSAMTAEVRIADSRINPSETVDVIALLLAAAANPAECLTPEEKPAEVIAEPEEEEPVEEQSGSRRGFIDRLGAVLRGMIDGKEDDSDFYDDEDDR